MKLHTLLLTQNNCFKTGKTITPKGLMLHSTGCNNPNLSRYVGPNDGILGVNPNNNHWNTPLPDGRQVCVHGWVGLDAKAIVRSYQTLPWNMRGWHAGGNANDTHIGVEICEDNLGSKDYFDLVYREAVELFAYLSKEYKLNPLEPGVIICHSEGYKMGIASNHSDVMHWFPKYGKNMDIFRQEVKEQMDGAPVVVEKPIMDIPADWAKQSWQWAIDNGITDGTRPYTSATRQEVIALIYNAVKFLNK